MKNSPDTPAPSRGRFVRPSIRILSRAAPSILLPLFAAVIASGQQASPRFSGGDPAGTIIERETAYEGKALYGYIDGGAELYFEYGFRRVLVQEIASEMLHVHLEIFEMDSPRSAAGIFSVSHHGCSTGGDPWDFMCAGRFQVQRARGRYFVRGANVSGTPAESSLTAVVVRLVASEIEDSAYSPPALFRDSLLAGGQQSFRIAQGPLGLENGLDDWREIAESAGKFSLNVLVQELEGIETRVGLLEFDSGGGDAFDPVRWDEGAPQGKRRFALAGPRRRMILCETGGDESVVEKYRSALEQYRDK